MPSNQDNVYLSQALDLAKIRRGFCSPNPSVGAVIVKEGNILSTGYHFAASSPHAEVDALKKLSSSDVEGATIYVTLEPCSHFGRTPPCTDALIKSGIKRVVYGYSDPNPNVAGKGAALLQARGIQCEHVPLPTINAFYESYTHWLRTKEPFITAKIALTLDGKIAGKEGERIQITGKALQELTHASRKAADAILTTVKTILHDDPQLNVRQENETIAKPIYILDSELNLPFTATLFKTAKSLVVFHGKLADLTRQKEMTDRGVRCVAVEKNEYGLDLKQVIQQVGQDGIQDLWIEAGGECFSAFLKQKLLQRAFIYVAPCWLGEGQSAFGKEMAFHFHSAEIQWKQFGMDALCDIRW